MLRHARSTGHSNPPVVPARERMDAGKAQRRSGPFRPIGRQTEGDGIDSPGKVLLVTSQRPPAARADRPCPKCSPSSHYPCMLPPPTSHETPCSPASSAQRSMSACALLAVRQHSTTCAPARASARAVSRPMPLHNNAPRATRRVRQCGRGAPRRGRAQSVQAQATERPAARHIGATCEITPHAPAAHTKRVPSAR